MNRGDRREAIFADDADRQRFLETLTKRGQLVILSYLLATIIAHLQALRCLLIVNGTLAAS
jgi:hypothetical protein